jgi:hypothetical protein
MTLGEFYLSQENVEKGRSFLKRALTFDVASLEERKKIEDLIEQSHEN